MARHSALSASELPGGISRGARVARWRWCSAIALTTVIAAACGGGGADSGNEPVAGGAEERAPAAAADPVQEYIAFSASVDEGSQGADAAYVADGLRGLAGALGTMGLGDAALTVDLRVAAEHVLLNAASVDIARTVRGLFVSAAAAIAMRDAAAGAPVVKAAEAVGPDRPLPEQAAPVRTFFHESAAALQRLQGER